MWRALLVNVCTGCKGSKYHACVTPILQCTFLAGAGIRFCVAIFKTWSSFESSVLQQILKLGNVIKSEACAQRRSEMSSHARGHNVDHIKSIPPVTSDPKSA